MRVSELIDMLKDQPQDAEVEMAIVAPVNETDDDDITVDRYSVEGILPWQDDDSDDGEGGEGEADDAVRIVHRAARDRLAGGDQGVLEIGKAHRRQVTGLRG